MRIDRNKDELRLVNIERNYLKYPAGSVLMTMGDTKIIITATVEDRVPKWLHRTGKGWLTAEYNMLPASTQTRRKRDSYLDGRSVEISRLIGRVLRTCVDLGSIGERTIWIDCDVIQADGGTRCASITAAYVALYEACYKYYKKGIFKTFPIKSQLAAVSVGKVDGQILLDLDYQEDSVAQVDSNIVINSEGEFIEIQSSGEESSFTAEEFATILDYGRAGVRELIHDQNYSLGDLKREIESEKDSCRD